MNFGNAKTDALIDQIRTEMDVKKRDELYKEWQQITHDEVLYIFYMYRISETVYTIDLKI